MYCSKGFVVVESSESTHSLDEKKTTGRSDRTQQGGEGELNARTRDVTHADIAPKQRGLKGRQRGRLRDSSQCAYN